MQEQKFENMLRKFLIDSADKQHDLNKRGMRIDNSLSNQELNKRKKLKQDKVNLKKQVKNEHKQIKNDGGIVVSENKPEQKEVKSENKMENGIKENKHIDFDEQYAILEKRLFVGLSKYLEGKMQAVIKRFNYLESVLEPIDKKSTEDMIRILQAKGYQIVKPNEFDFVFDGSGNKIGKINKVTKEFIKLTE